MSHDQFKEWIKRHGFSKVADIVDSRNGYATFEYLEGDVTGWGYVYIWTEESNQQVKTVYVGKAGQTLKKRCGEHLGGFRGGSKIGGKHSRRILEGISAGNKYSVYARKSDSKTILGVKNISMCSVEEVALIRKLAPEWNSLRS